MRLLSLSLAALTLLAGCDAEGSLLGAFEGRTQVGPETRLVEGEAVYTVVDGPDGPAFVLGLFVGDLYESDRHAYDFVLLRRAGGVPGVGAFPVRPDPERRAFSAEIARVDEADDPLEANGVALAGVDGTVVVTAVDAYGFVAGSYDFRAAGLRLPPRRGEVSGSARGTFEARYVPPSTFRRLDLEL